MHRHDSSLHNGGERATSLAFCRDTITRIADKGHLQRAHIETLLSERVRKLKFFIWQSVFSNNIKPEHYLLHVFFDKFVALLFSWFFRFDNSWKIMKNLSNKDRAMYCIK